MNREYIYGYHEGDSSDIRNKLQMLEKEYVVEVLSILLKKSEKGYYEGFVFSLFYRVFPKEEKEKPSLDYFVVNGR